MSKKVKFTQNKKRAASENTTLMSLVYLAYRKFKAHVYYDSSSLFLRKKLAEFEFINFKNADDKESFRKCFLETFKNVLDCLDGNDDVLQELIKDINYIPIPKSVEQNRPWKEKDRFITNIIQPNDFKITKCNALVDAPIEIHVLSVLWLITVGKKLNSAISPSNYAYRLSLYDKDNRKPIDSDKKEDKTLSSGLMLFEPYFIGYQQWRDNGIRKAEQGLDEKKDVTMLSLDIRRYFYSIRMNVVEDVNFWIKRKGLEKLTDLEERLCDIIQLIHKDYAYKLNESPFVTLSPVDIENNRFPLPVGLLSSGFLGNIGLSLFDEYVHQSITPSYYGRYVDDILMVFIGKKLNPFSKNEKFGESLSPIDYFIRQHLIRKQEEENECHLERDENLKVNQNNEPSYFICFHGNRLEIQSGKVLMEYFKYTESRAAINKFKKKLQESSSEFRLLPFESDVNKEFDDAAFKLEYSDSVNRLRDVRAISEDKYGASKYLAQKIFLSILPFDFDDNEKVELKKSAEQILTFFRGVNSLQMYGLWEKVASYFVINSDTKSLNRFFNQSLDAIEEISSVKIGVAEENEDDYIISEFSQHVKERLKDHLFISLAMALSLNPTLLNGKIIPSDLEYISKIQNLIEAFRVSYLFRHNYQYLKAFCYTLDRIKDWEKPLTGKNILSEPVGSIKIDVAKYLSPVFLHIHDIALILNYNNVVYPDHEEKDC